MSEKSPPFITDVHHAEVTPVNEPVNISLKGNWPTPSWEHHKTDIAYDTEEQTVKIRYLGKQKSGMALQVLKPFSTTIEITLESEGTWRMIVEGRGQDLESLIQVT